jgi:phosphopantothenoylcysteine synthetase/decarboxylase
MIKTGYFDWKEDNKAKAFIKKMHQQKMKVYHLERNEDAYALIAAKQKPISNQIVGLKSGGYESSGKPHKFNTQDARLRLTEVTEKDFEDNNNKQNSRGGVSWW